MDSLDPATLRGWTPVRVRTRAAEPSADWALVDRPFTAPFFEQTADEAMRHPFNQLFLRATPLRVFDALGDELRDDAVAGVIFHMSRSGSTLVAQMLSRLSSVLVLSEPQPVDGVLRFHLRGARAGDGAFGEAAFARRLRGLVRAYRGDGEQRIVLKFHAWHVLELPRIMGAFPGVPWAFVFREPRAVLRSQARQPGAEAIPGTIDPAYLGVRDAAELVAPDYGARVLGAFCDAALRHAGHGRPLFVEYASLPDAAFSRVLPHFGLAPSVHELRALHDTATRDAKDASAPFSHTGGGGANGTAPGGAAVPGDGAFEAEAARWLDAPYAALRALAAVPA